MILISKSNFVVIILMLLSNLIFAQQHINSSVSYAMPNSCGIMVNAGPDITICAGIGKSLNGNVVNSVDYNWEPPDGLSNPKIIRPIANPTMTTTYTLTARALSGNLITNGNFETGSIAPATTNYTLYTDLNLWASSTGGYMVMSVPQIAAQFGCNPNVGAFTLGITPTGSSSNIWCQTRVVNPNTDYKIEFKLIGIPYIFSSPPDIGLKVNGTLVGSKEPDSGFCTETTASFVWNSGGSSSATFCLANYGGTGMFAICAIDDITIKECCVEKDEVTVTVYDLVTEVAPFSDIDCLNKPITLDATASSQGPGITYLWTTKNGRIVSGEKSLNPVVDTPGTYTFKITGLYGCEKELMVTVNGSVTKPDISIKTIDLDCKNSTGSLEASSKSSSPQFEWFGPGGFYSTRAKIINLKEPGEFLVKVTDSYGCESNLRVELKDNRNELAAEIIGDSISCAKDSAILKANSIAKKPKYNWTGPSAYKKDSSIQVIVRDTGWYFLTTIDSAGCSELDSFYVKSLLNNISIRLSADTIDCNSPEVKIIVKADSVSSFQWIGPNGFTSNDLEPLVSDSGWYYLKVLTKYGCSGIDSIYILQSNDIPDIFISGSDTINCNKIFININGGSNSAGAQIEWNTPSGIIKNQQMIQATDSGRYTLMVTGFNGCVVTRNLQIFKDITKPFISVRNDTLNCNRDSLHLMAMVDNVRLYSWIGPAGFSSSQMSPLINTKGNYTLTVTAKNGCTSSAEIIIEEDRLIPSLSIKSDTINCFQLSISPQVIADSSVSQFNWEGPNGFNSLLKSPAIANGGLYTLTIKASNGCENSETILITEDIQKPFARLEADTIQCKTTASLRALNITPGASIEWSGPKGFSSNITNPIISESGFYKITITGKNGCVLIDSIFVFQKDQLPDISVKEDTLSCNRLKLFLSGGSTTVGVRYEWTGPNGFMSSIPNPEIQDSGLYTLKVIDMNGCEAIRQVRIPMNSSPSIITIQKSNDLITCKDSLVMIQLTANHMASSIQWTGPNGFTSMADQLTIKDPGMYLIVFTNEFGCETKDSFIIQDKRKLPNFTVADDSINCIRKLAILQLTSTDTDISFQWSGPNNFMSTLQNPGIQNGGTYSVTVTNTADCQLIKTLFVNADTTKPDLSLSADTISCRRTDAPVKAGSSLQGFTMRWMGPNGFNYTLPQFVTKIPGKYICTITNPRSGCATTDSIFVLEDTSRIRNVIVEAKNASCNKNNGKISITQITGGKAPFKYSLDMGQSFISDLNSLDLAPGNYTVLVEDINTCRFTSNVSIGQDASIDISLLNSIILKLGEQSVLNLIFLTNPNDIANIFWTPDDQLSCNNCPDPVLTANHDDLIFVRVTDKNGCIDTASIRLIIQKESKHYFPNVFSPNGDNINDYFYPISINNEGIVKFLHIYDRWGNRIFSKSNFMVGLERDGWNGNSNDDDKLNPGVYIYQVEIIDQGIKYHYFGDITLVR